MRPSSLAKEAASEGKSRFRSAAVCGWERAAAALDRQRCSRADFRFRGERRKRLEVDSGGASTSHPAEVYSAFPSASPSAPTARRLWKRVVFPSNWQYRSKSQVEWRRREWSGLSRSPERYCESAFFSLWMSRGESRAQLVAGSEVEQDRCIAAEGLTGVRLQSKRGKSPLLAHGVKGVNERYSLRSAKIIKQNAPSGKLCRDKEVPPVRKGKGLSPLRRCGSESEVWNPIYSPLGRATLCPVIGNRPPQSGHTFGSRQSGRVKKGRTPPHHKFDIRTKLKLKEGLWQQRN